MPPFPHFSKPKRKVFFHIFRNRNAKCDGISDGQTVRSLYASAATIRNPLIVMSFQHTSTEILQKCIDILSKKAIRNNDIKGKQNKSVFSKNKFIVKIAS